MASVVLLAFQAFYLCYGAFMKSDPSVVVVLERKFEAGPQMRHSWTLQREMAGF